jgi:hypothetical protein
MSMLYVGEMLPGKAEAASWRVCWRVVKCGEWEDVGGGSLRDGVPGS